ncbi:hypothetical protein [Fischerella thermalis]|uniref:hypothetical protein n=1 Tax=Fischerella thermalis TaxID=372787 RepID=UPI0015E081BE|nr:hypothetical protein [Fischerella thermalis]
MNNQEKAIYWLCLKTASRGWGTEIQIPLSLCQYHFLITFICQAEDREDNQQLIE